MAISLYKHQRKGVDALASRPRCLLQWDAGTGKTHTILSICNERPMKTLVFCPVSLVENAWCRDAAHYPNLKVINGRANGKAKRLEKIKSEWDILVINYESGKLHVPELLAAGFKRFICDESDYIINPAAQQSMACVRLALHADECYLLSATPACGGGHQFFNQLACVAPTETGVNYWRWANRYFVPLKINVRGRDVIKGFRLREDRKDDFHAMLKRHVWPLTAAECLDLPSQTFIERWVDLSSDEQHAYDSMLTRLRAEFAGKVIDASAASKTMKLRQITSGFVYHEETPVEVGSTKMDELVSILKEIGPRPVVIWAIFTADIERIVAYLESGKLGWEAPVYRLDGTTSDRYKTSSIVAFQHGGDGPRYIVAHPQSVAHGVTLTAASYMVHYSRGFSTKLYIQGNKRIHRISQEHPCFYYTINARGTIDEGIDKTLKGQIEAVDALRAVLACEASTPIADEVLSRF